MDHTNRDIKKTPRKLQQDIFFSQTMLIILMALVLAVAGCSIVIRKELQTDDQNLKNIAETIARSNSVYAESVSEENELAMDYFDSLKESLWNIDVLSIINKDGIRIYHSNHQLIGTDYEGTIPDFEKNSMTSYTENSIGPSGSQRRAYAPVFDADGNYDGFVIAVMLRTSINSQILSIVLSFLVIMILAIAVELIISHQLSTGIKKSLMGYEPDAFSAMYKIRDEILESLQEGVIAVDEEGSVKFFNQAASQMVGPSHMETYADSVLSETLKTGIREMNRSETTISGVPVIQDKIPIIENEQVEGAVAILHNREEYTKLMEDLAGTRYLVESMRANNHDFTNKLHVILGLLQMEDYEVATSYIEEITLVRQEMISKIMHMVDEPTIAALLIGKTAKASEKNIKFTLQEGSHYQYSDYPLPPESLNTIIGNLIENAFDAMDVDGYGQEKTKELLLGIHSRPGALIITVDDTGIGMSQAVRENIFQNGFSTKGENRGTGLYQSKQLVESLGGSMDVESQEGIGSSFTITFMK